ALKRQVQPYAQIVDSRILPAEELGVAHVHPAGFNAEAIVDLRADTELGLEQHAAAEIDLVVGEVLERLGGAGVDGEADAGPDVDALAELRGEADRSIARLPRRVQRAERIWLERRAEDLAPAVAEHHVRAGLDPALVGGELDIVVIEAAENLAGVRRSGGGERQAKG